MRPIRRDRRRRAHDSAVVMACLVGASALGACSDDDSWTIDASSGATTSRGGSSSSTAATGGRGGGPASGASAGSSDAGSVGEGGEPAAYPAPSIDSMEPSSGAYGTRVTITGQGLGSATRDGFRLLLGDGAEVELTPDGGLGVESWSDEEIVFRFPFPAAGAVVLEAPRGSIAAGDFQPTWRSAQALASAPGGSVLASVSTEPGHIVMLFDTMPLTLLDLGPEGATPIDITAPAVEPSSVRLYLDAQSTLQGIGVSSGANPVLVPLENEAGALVAAPTNIELQATEFAVAGGSEGAAVWMRRAAGWRRARPGASTWALDKGPIADADSDAPDRASGATSDGSLFVAWSVDTGNFLDDMEAPHMARLAPAATQFSASKAAGTNVDDYVTGLTLTSRGDGLVVRYCGSDVDPFNLSGVDYYCYDALHAPGGAVIGGVPVNSTAIAHAFTHERAVVAYCAGDDSWLIRTDVDTEGVPGAPLGEPVLYPCPQAVALEVDGDGDYLPVIRHAGMTYLLERNPDLPAP